MTDKRKNFNEENENRSKIKSRSSKIALEKSTEAKTRMRIGSLRDMVGGLQFKSYARSPAEIATQIGKHQVVMTMEIEPEAEYSNKKNKIKPNEKKSLKKGGTHSSEIDPDPEPRLNPSQEQIKEKMFPLRMS